MADFNLKKFHWFLWSPTFNLKNNNKKEIASPILLLETILSLFPCRHLWPLISPFVAVLQLYCPFFSCTSIMLEEIRKPLFLNFESTWLYRTWLVGPTHTDQVSMLTWLDWRSQPRSQLRVCIHGIWMLRWWMKRKNLNCGFSKH